MTKKFFIEYIRLLKNAIERNKEISTYIVNKILSLDRIKSLKNKVLILTFNSNWTIEKSFFEFIKLITERYNEKEIREETTDLDFKKYADIFRDKENNEVDGIVMNFIKKYNVLGKVILSFNYTNDMLYSFQSAILTDIIKNIGLELEKIDKYFDKETIEQIMYELSGIGKIFGSKKIKFSFIDNHNCQIKLYF